MLIQVDAGMLGGTVGTVVECEVSEPPGSRERLVIFQTSFDPRMGYTLCIQRQDEPRKLRQIGIYSPSGGGRC